MKQAYINAILLDGTENMTPIEGKTIYVQDGVITKIDTSTPDDTWQIVDANHHYMMPGLINLHVHLPATGKPKKKPTDPVKLVKLVLSNPLTKAYGFSLCAHSAKTELLSGVTTLRTVGGAWTYDTQVRQAIASGKRIGPRILASDMAISVEGGHMAHSLAYAASSPEEALQDLDQILQTKPDLVKLMITGGVLDAKVRGEPGVLKMDPAIVKAVCDKAHGLGLKVAAHVESTEGVRVALQNGVDTIEHGAALDPDILALFKERNAKVVCTISPALPYALFDRSETGISEDTQYNGKLVMDGIITCARQALANGIPVGLGTDVGCPYITHYDMWRELFYFHKYCEVSNAFALHTATQVNASIAQLDHVGLIQEGYSADFVFCKNNPLDSLTALRSPSMVVTQGKIIEHPHQKKMPEVEQALDRYIQE